MLGQGMMPAGYDPMVDSLPFENTCRFLQHIKDVTAKTADAMPTHESFIDRHCSAPQGGPR
jgi:tryptophan 7-halogenase